MSLYHGGKAGLAVGELLLPPAETGASSCADLPGGHVCRRDRVYLTPSVDEARIYAGLCPGGGDVYEASPVGPTGVEHELSLTCRSARIIRVVERGLNAERALELMRQTETVGV